MTVPNTPEAIANLAEQLMHGLEGLSGLRFGFDLSSLSALDDWLTEWLDMAAVYDAPAAQSDTSLVEPLAAYIGEVLVRATGASWDFSVRDPESFPPLLLANGRRLDLAAAVLTVFQRLAPPAFAQLGRLGEQSAS